MVTKNAGPGGSARKTPAREVKRAGITFNIHDDDYRRVAQEQRDAIMAEANRIERGKPLMDPDWTAAVLRHAAESIPLEQPKGKGQPRRFDHGSLSLRYGWLRHHDSMEHGDAVRHLAIEFDVSEVAINKALPLSVQEEALRQFQSAHLVKKNQRGQR